MRFLTRFTKLMKSDPVAKSRPKAAWIIDESKCLAGSEVIKLQKVALKSKSKGVQNRRLRLIRNWFMIELGLCAGLRVGEMASLSHGDFLVDNGRSSIRVTGKGQKMRPVWIGTDLREQYHEYRECLSHFGYSVEGESPALPNQSGGFISKRTLQKAFKLIASQSDLPGHYSVHCLRHTYATFLLKASNYNYRFVQKQLGHASIRTTQVYASVVETDARQAIERLYRT